MGTSSETFNKKEREKKKLKKQQEKKEKAEDRKTNAAKGKGLEDMMAYVDANGNLTSVPQDLSLRKKVSADDIQIAVPKQEHVEEEIVRNGTVAFFNDSKGFGFIRDLQTQESIFVHVNALTEQIRENDKVTFEIEQGQKGPTAVKVKKTVK
ncbi:cold shock domain-containing protein [Mucilaginibacter terrenus]|uniref:Cold shock domain-containing protein n=1 Tax=Mucilaginibacter terrenus TaxID=2482727 RepID=A0A3E2NX31_9SPHI|nr:cold shock domain-containing protein [Mucilaginibacter terrenus]RFZ85575.1 cold shock domain-containing protein [Mucilaginibacter terrenus]